MGSCSTKLEEEQQYYNAENHNSYKQKLNTQLPQNGIVTKSIDKYAGAQKMISNKAAVIPSGSSIGALSEQLELNLSVRNIPKLDLLSPSDPFILVSVKDEANNRYNLVDKTEIIWDNPNADFSKDIRITYKFEEVQYVKLDIYDANNEQTNNLSTHDYIGYAEFVVGDLVTANSQKLVMVIKSKNAKPLKKVKGRQPIVIVRSQEVNENYDEIEFQLSSNGLPKMDTFGSIDPFIQIYRSTNDGSWASVYKSEHYKNTNKPNWKKFRIQSRRLCHGDLNRPILIKCFDWNRDARPDYACEIKTTLGKLIDVKTIEWKQYNYKKNKYKNKKCGKLLIKHINIIKNYSFISYLNGGLELELIVAIDFTGSNGNPSDKSSLHYMGPPYYSSQYLKVIKSVGRVLAPYDSDGNIGAYGFGANLNPNGKQVSHCFNLTLKPDCEEVDGINGLIDAYKNCLKKVQLYGPTYFSEIIQNVSAKSMNICNQNNQSYHILLIITDGVINDMQKSINSIVNATKLPMSIIIVGVGNADFGNMEILDADDVPLRNNVTGKLMKRDIVQFVPFNEFKNKHISCIAKEVLEEVPRQVTSFMSMHHIHPNPSQIDDNSRIDGGSIYSNIHDDDKDDIVPDIIDQKQQYNYNDYQPPTAPAPAPATYQYAPGYTNMNKTNEGIKYGNQKKFGY